MKKIETKEQLHDWANRANQPLKTYCDLQDEFAHSKLNDLKKFFMATERHEKELIIFAISKCMGSCTLLDFISIYAMYKFEHYVMTESEELDKQRAELAIAKEKFEREREQLQATMSNLVNRNAELTIELDDMDGEAATRARKIYSLESEIEGLREELKDLRRFEIHIKKLLEGGTGETES